MARLTDNEWAQLEDGKLDLRTAFTIPHDRGDCWFWQDWDGRVWQAGELTQDDLPMPGCYMTPKSEWPEEYTFSWPWEKTDD